LKVAENHLKQMPYDRLLVECEPFEGDAGAQLLLNGFIRTVVTTTGIDLRPGRPPIPDDARVVVKPFRVDRIRESLDGLVKLSSRR